MFWGGAAFGAFVVLALIAAGLGVISWQVAKERRKEEKEPLNHKKYWEESLEVQSRNAETFEQILTVLDNWKR